MFWSCLLGGYHSSAESHSPYMAKLARAEDIERLNRAVVREDERVRPKACEEDVLVSVSAFTIALSSAKSFHGLPPVPRTYQTLQSVEG